LRNIACGCTRILAPRRIHAQGVIKAAPFLRRSSHADASRQTASRADSGLQIMMLITSEDVVSRYLKNTSIPFTCRPFSESAVPRMHRAGRDFYRVSARRRDRVSLILIPPPFLLTSIALRKGHLVDIASRTWSARFWLFTDFKACTCRSARVRSFDVRSLARFDRRH